MIVSGNYGGLMGTGLPGGHSSRPPQHGCGVGDREAWAWFLQCEEASSTWEPLRCMYEMVESRCPWR